MNIREMHYDFKKKFNKTDIQKNRNLLVPEIYQIFCCQNKISISTTFCHYDKKIDMKLFITTEYVCFSNNING